MTIDDLNISARLLAKEAVAQGWSVELLDKTSAASGSPVMMCTKDRREIYLKNLFTSLNSPIASFIERDKITAYDILSRKGLPVPDTLILRRSDVTQGVLPQEAQRFLVKHGSLVVKPSNTDHGDGVSVGVNDEHFLTSAVQYAIASSQDADVLIQQCVHGDEYRFLVLQGKVIAVANRRPPSVIGDGIHNVSQLIDIKNAEPQRSRGHTSILTTIDKQEVGHFLGSKELLKVPSAGVTVELLKTSNLSRGGESVDCTDIASEKLQDIAIRSAKACQLGIAGIDIITESIQLGDKSNSYVIETNASPGIRMHQFPAHGQPRDVSKMIFDTLVNTSMDSRDFGSAQ